MPLTLDRAFETDLTRALLDDAERQLVGERDNLVFQAVQASHDRLRAWGRERDYDVEPVIEALQTPEITRTDDRLTVEWGWDHPAAPYFQYGTSDHTIEGEPVLSFVWDREDAPRWVKKEFDREAGGYRVFFGEVEVSGIARTNFVGAGVRWLEQHLRD